MKLYDKNGDVIVFRAHVGNGEYRGRKFHFGTATTPAGDLLGLPVVSWDDGTVVAFEMADLIPRAYTCAFGEVEP